VGGRFYEKDVGEIFEPQWLGLSSVTGIGGEGLGLEAGVESFGAGGGGQILRKSRWVNDS